MREMEKNFVDILRVPFLHLAQGPGIARQFIPTEVRNDPRPRFEYRAI